MAKEIKTEISIDAPASIVWKILTDFESYPEWNPFFKYVKGEKHLGGRLEIAIEGMRFKPVVLAYEPNRELRWLGSLLFKGLFDGEHRFVLETSAGNRTIFKHSERFTGAISFLFGEKLLRKTEKGFEGFNLALKLRAEDRAKQ